MNVDVSKRAALVIAVIAGFLFPFLSSAINIALPTIGREFSMNAVVLGWVNNAYLITGAAFLVSVGRLADIYGRRKIFLYGNLLFIVVSFLCAVSNSTALFITARALGGLSGSVMMATATAILTSVFPPRERGRAIGIQIAAAFLGISMGPFLGGVLTQYLGWQSIFYICALLGLVIIVLAGWKLRGEWADARGERFDVVGSIAFSLSLILIIYGLTQLTSALGIVFVLPGLLGMLIFVWWEGKVEHPVLNLDLFRRNRVFVFSNLAALIISSAGYAVPFLFSLYLQYNRGLSPSAAGLVLLASTAVQALVSPVAGRLSDRFEPRKIAATGMAISCMALVIFAFLTEETALGLILVGMCIFGTGMALFVSPNANAVMSSVDKRFLGVASGVMGTMRTFGFSLNMAIVMMLFSVYIGQAEITPEYYPAFLLSTRVVFAISAILCLCSVLAQLAAREKPGSVRNPAGD
ncbi:MFS transporter [Chloroflexota bacterium]